MKLKMKIGLSGPALSLSPGDPHETDDIEGQRLIDARFADLAAEETLEQRIERLAASLSFGYVRGQIGVTTRSGASRT